LGNQKHFSLEIHTKNYFYWFETTYQYIEMVSKILILFSLVSLFLYSNQLDLCSSIIGDRTLSDDLSEFEALQDEIEDIDEENTLYFNRFRSNKIAISNLKNTALKSIATKPDDTCDINCSDLSSSCAKLHPRNIKYQVDPVLFLKLGKPALDFCKNGTNFCGSCKAIQSFGTNYFGADKFALFLGFLKNRVCELSCGQLNGVIVTNGTFEKGISSTWDGMEEYQRSFVGSGRYRRYSMMGSYRQIRDAKNKWDSDSKMYSLLLSNLWQNLFHHDRDEIKKNLYSFVAPMKERMDRLFNKLKIQFF
jgi:hypothetical protein